MKHSSRFVIGLGVAGFLAACHGHGTNDPCGEPEYGGVASDEAWVSVVEGEKQIMANDAKAAALTTPTQGQVFPGSGASPLLEWTAGAVGTSVQGALWKPPAERFATRAPAERRSAWSWLKGLVEGTAWAHKPPVTGPIFYLRFAVPGRQCEVRAITTEVKYQVSAAAFAAFKAAGGQPITLSVTSAYLRENRITEGPYKATTPRTFTVTQ